MSKANPITQTYKNLCPVEWTWLHSRKSTEVSLARRGRPRKDGKQVEELDHNIMYDIKSGTDLNEKPLKFADGSEIVILNNEATQIFNYYLDLKPLDRLEFQEKLQKSRKDFITIIEETKCLGEKQITQIMLQSGAVH